MLSTRNYHNISSDTTFDDVFYDYVTVVDYERPQARRLRMALWAAMKWIHLIVDRTFNLI